MEGQGFTYVGRRGRANKKANVKAKISFLEALDLAKRDLPIGWEESVPGLDVDGVLCIGLGSPSTSLDARYQLLYLIELVNKSGVVPLKVELYDPIFNDDDIRELQGMGYIAVAGPAMMDRRLDESTIAFMPHCEASLYDNFLRSNWSKESLKRITLIANDLRAYADNLSGEKLRTRFPFIARIVPFVRVTSLPKTLTSMDAFSNMAMQTFDVAAEDSFWDVSSISKEQNTEAIS